MDRVLFGLQVPALRGQVLPQYFAAVLQGIVTAAGRGEFVLGKPQGVPAILLRQPALFLQQALAPLPCPLQQLIGVVHPGPCELGGLLGLGHRLVPGRTGLARRVQRLFRGLCSALRLFERLRSRFVVQFVGRDRRLRGFDPLQCGGQGLLGIPDPGVQLGLLPRLALEFVLSMADGLFQPRHRGRDVVELRLRGLQIPFEIGPQHSLLLRLGLLPAALGLQTGQRGLRRHEFLILTGQPFLLPAQAQQQQFRTPLAPGRGQVLVALGDLGLPGELGRLTVHFLAHVVQPLQVLARVADAVFGLAPALLVLGDARRLL